MKRRQDDISELYFLCGCPHGACPPPCGRHKWMVPMMSIKNLFSWNHLFRYFICFVLSPTHPLHPSPYPHFESFYPSYVLLSHRPDQCCPTFLTPRAAQDIIMKPRAAPVNSKETTKICGTLKLLLYLCNNCNFLNQRYAHATFHKCYPSSVTHCHKSRTPPLKYVTFST